MLGVSRFTSQYRLWHEMSGRIEPEPHKDIFDTGHAFEAALAALWRIENPGWQLSPGEVQIARDALGFPALVTLDRRARRGNARRVVEFKVARSLEDWGDEFTDEAPADYVAQVTAQMLFTGYTKHPAHLVVMGPFFRHHTYVIEYDKGIADTIHQRCQAFYESLAGDTPPPLDDTVMTYQTVRALHPDIDGSTVEVDPELAWRVLEYDHATKANEACLRGAKTRLLDAMGNAQTAVCGGVKVADRRPHARGGVACVLATKNLDQLMSTTDNESEF